MKKFLALLMAVLMSLSVFSLIACNLPTDSEGESRCAECVSFGTENSYKIDGMTMVFAGLVSILWPLATLYGFEYMEHHERKETFFMFYSMF